MVAQFFWPCIMGDASITEAQLNLHQKLGCILFTNAGLHSVGVVGVEPSGSR
jgi:hypothetical protein